MEGNSTIGGASAIGVTMEADRQAKQVPITFGNREHAEIKGEGPWVFMASRSKKLKVAVGRMKPRFTPLGIPLLGPIVWAQFKNFRFVTKDKEVAIELRYSSSYDVSFSLVSDVVQVEETPLQAGNERKTSSVKASAIAAPIRTIDELEGEPEPQDRTPPKKGQQETIRRG
jgi:hypothetical protein